MGGKNRKLLGYPNKRLGEVSLKSIARQYEISYGRLYRRVALKKMSLDEALSDLKVKQGETYYG